MRSQVDRFLGIGAILVGSFAVGAGCVTSEGSDDPAKEPTDAPTSSGSNDPAVDPTDVSTGGTTVSTAGEGGAGGAEPVTAGTAGAAESGVGGAPVATAGAGGVAGVQCLGDTWKEEPDCSAMPKCEAANGGAGGSADGSPVGVADCEYYVEYMRKGVAEAFAECVASLDVDPCNEDAFNNAIDICEGGVTAAVCESPEAAEHCESVDCSSLGDQCVAILSVYPEATQQAIVDCYNDSGDDGTDACHDTFLDCEAGGGTVECLGDTWEEEPDCSALPTCAAANGGAGGGTGESPVGVADCEYYVEYMRQGVAEAFAECVASLDEDPCNEEAYQQAVDNCEAGVTSSVCASPSAAEHCESVDCSSLGDQCVAILSVYPEAAQQTIMTCYDESGDDSTADCYDTFLDCEAGGE